MRPGGRADGGDDGAALILALLIVMVVAVVVSAMLSFGDTSVRVTVALRAQAAGAYAADGAGQAAVNALRTDPSSAMAGQCFSTSSNWQPQLPNFYPGSTGAPATSAYVSCTPDSGNGSGGGATSPNASPGSAILTLGTGTGGEDGIKVNSNAGPIKIRGGVFSNSTINIASGGISNTFTPASSAYNLARGACVNQNLITPAAATTCNYTAVDSRGTDPGTLTPHGASYNAPAAPTGNGTIGTCGGSVKYQTVTPGRFTSVAALNALTGCTTGIVNFTPGTYYFDFKDTGLAHNWVVQNTYVIAGTPTIPLTSTPTPAQMPTACVAPADAAATTSSGVLFVFGGDSQLSLTHQGSPGAQVTICASASANGPPIAFYGLKTALSGSFPVSAQGGCTTALPASTPCAVISTDQSPKTTLTIQGTTYTVPAWININLNNSTNQVFRWGLITRALSVGTTGSADLSGALIDVPSVAANPNPTPNIMYLNVYVCEQSSTCGAAAGKLGLRIKVQVSASSPRTVTVLSWSTQR